MLSLSQELRELIVKNIFTFMLGRLIKFEIKCVIMKSLQLIRQIRGGEMISVSHCPDCRKKLKAKDSRMHTTYGFLTVKRRRTCLYCDFRVTTVELPLNIANDIFLEGDK